MRPSNKQRSRNKPGGSGNNPNNNNNRRSLGNIINRVFESAGPDGKVRGTPQQIIDKYQALARDAQLAGDRVAAESFLQHSEHYSRMLGEAQAAQGEARGYEREDGRRDDDPLRDGYPDAAREPLGRDGSFREPAGREASYRDPQQARDGRDGQFRDGGRDGQNRDGQQREARDRDAQSRDGRDRDGQPQQGGQQREGQPQRHPQRDQPRPPRPEREPKPVIASSLTTIDPIEDGELGGLIETPERGDAAPVPTPAPAPAPQVTAPLEPRPINGASHAAAAAEAPDAAVAQTAAEAAPLEAPKPKRGRPRRKAPVEGENAAPAPSE